jgi:futalosine hydrolase
MNILVVASTIPEIQGFVHGMEKMQYKHTVDVLISGIGMLATTYAVQKQIATKQYDFAVQAGICGAFDRSLQLGEVVRVNTETLSEFGVEDDAIFHSAFEMGLVHADTAPFRNGKIYLQCRHINCLKHVTLVEAITVNKVHGNEKSIEAITEKFNPQIESMEGAAFAYVCAMEQLECLELRSVSNYVEKRNTNKWQKELAINALEKTLTEVMNELNQ